MSDKDTNPNDVYYWMNKKIDYGFAGMCLTEEEEKERQKRGKAIRKAIMELEPEFLAELEKHDGRQ